jgi:hypothetical protein
MPDAKKPSVTEMRKRKFADQVGMGVSADGVLADSFFDSYSVAQGYEEGFEAAFDGKYIVDLIKAI